MVERKFPIKDLILWPNKSVANAKLAVLPSFIFACISASMWTIAAILGAFYPSKYGEFKTILLAIMWILIAWGLRKKIPIVAMVGLFTFVVAIIFDWGRLSKELHDFAMVTFYIQAIQGTLAYKRLSNERVTPPRSPS